jgi:hypothetical protein
MVSLLLFVGGCASVNLADFEKPKETSIQIIREIPGQSKEAIFEKSKMWIARNFKSTKAVIEYDNKDNGTIIGNGVIDRPLSAVYAGSFPSTISFTMNQEIKDGKIRLTFDKLQVHWPAGYSAALGAYPASDAPISYQADFDGAKAKLMQLADSLVSELSKKQSDSW